MKRRPKYRAGTELKRKSRVKVMVEHLPSIHRPRFESQNIFESEIMSRSTLCYYTYINDRVSVCRPNCWSLFVDRAVLELIETRLCLWSAGFKDICHHTCATMSGNVNKF